MNLNQKIIKPKIGLLELAKSLGSVSSACKTNAIHEIAITGSKSYLKQEVRKLYTR